jgi:hypothetical protein
MKKTPWILPLPKSDVSNERLFRIVRRETYIIPPPLSSVVMDDSPSHIIGPHTQELQNIKNIILTLQLDLQKERIKRECLEEKVKNFESNLTRQSHEIDERKWHLSDMRIPNEEIAQDQYFLLARDTINNVDQKIEELRSDFDLRLCSFDQSLLEIRSILVNNPDDTLKRDGKYH